VHSEDGATIEFSTSWPKIPVSVLAGAAFPDRCVRHIPTISVVVDDRLLVRLMRSIASGDRDDVVESLTATPALAAAQLTRRVAVDSGEDLFLDQCLLQLYAGDTALHVAAAAYDLVIARRLLADGADVHARNRRGGEPLHAAVTGDPNSPNWNPTQQAAMVAFLIESGGDPNAEASGGVTPLHRAVRNRCTGAVGALLEGGADPTRPNDHGSTPMALARSTTGRGGTGSEAAKAEQAMILAMLTSATGVTGG
jgi:hypothetical protein